MDLNSVNTSTSTGTLLIELTDTDFPATDAGLLTGLVGGTTGGSSEFWVYKDPDNQEFGSSDISLHLGPFGPGAFSGDASIVHDALLAYSMTLVAQLTHGAGVVTSSFNLNVINSVPEPGALILLGTGLVAVAVWGFRKARG
jgi:hypothetical protein